MCHADYYRLECMGCHRKTRYLPNKEFSGDFPFRYVLDWYTYQEDYINSLDTLSMVEAPIIRDRCSLYQVALYSKKQLLADNVELALYGDRIKLTGGFREVFPFGSVENITILGSDEPIFETALKIYEELK